MAILEDLKESFLMETDYDYICANEDFIRNIYMLANVSGNYTFNKQMLRNFDRILNGKQSEDAEYSDINAFMEIIAQKCLKVFGEQEEELNSWESIAKCLEKNELVLIDKISTRLKMIYPTYLNNIRRGSIDAQKKYTDLRWIHQKEEKTTEEMYENIKQGVENGQYKLKIIGNPGTGKTETMCHMLNKLVEEESNDSYYFFYIELVKVNDIEVNGVSRKALEDKKYIHWVIENALGFDFCSLDLLDFFEKIDNRKIVIFLDGFNEVKFEDGYSENIRIEIGNLNEMNISTIITDRLESRSPNVLGNAKTFKLASMNKEEFKDFVRRYDEEALAIINQNSEKYDIEKLCGDYSAIAPIDVLAIIDYIKDEDKQKDDRGIIEILPVLRIDKLLDRELNVKGDLRIGALKTMLYYYVTDASLDAKVKMAQPDITKFFRERMDEVRREDQHFTAFDLFNLAVELTIFEEDDGLYQFSRSQYFKYFLHRGAI